MNKAKLVFNQTLMISTGILFGIGIQVSLNYFLHDNYSFSWQWYIPLSIILTGFLCALASLFLVEDNDRKILSPALQIVFHCISVFAIVSVCGYLFHWYTDIREYIPIVIMYVIIYGFVWGASLWIGKTDEEMINDAIKDIRDEE